MKKKFLNHINQIGLKYYSDQIKKIMEHPFHSLIERNRALEHIVTRLETYFKQDNARDKLIQTARGYQLSDLTT